MYAYKPGDVIMKSEPWVFTVFDVNASTYCYACVKKPKNGKVRACTGCRFAHYCSEECQKRDWPLRHKEECKMLAKMRFALTYHQSCLFLMLKIIRKVKKGEIADLLGACVPAAHHNYETLMSHEHKLFEKNDPLLMQKYEGWTEFFQLVDPEMSVIPDFMAFCRMHGKIDVNAFSLFGEDSHFDDRPPVGQGIYLGPALFDHSCKANAVFSNSGRLLTFTAISEIEKFEDVRLQYAYPFLPKKVRRQHLLENFMFECNCSICTDSAVEAERLSFRCGTKTCTEVVPLDNRADLPCKQCGRVNSDLLPKARLAMEVAHEGQEKMFAIGDNLRSVAEFDKKLKVFLGLIESAEKIMHPSNFLLGVLYKSAAVLERPERSAQRLAARIDHFKKALVAMRKHLGDRNFAVTEIITGLASDFINSRQFRSALPFVQEALAGIKMIHGAESSLYKEWSGMETLCVFNVAD